MENLKKLMYWRGIGESYYNYRGELIEVSWENRLGLLSAMGVDVKDAEKVRSQAYELDIAPWKNWLMPLIVSPIDGESTKIPVNINPEELEQTFSYEVITENQTTIKGQFCPSELQEIGDYLHEGVRYTRRLLNLDCLPIGYHNLYLELGDQHQKAQVVSTPQQAYLPDGFAEGKKPWGIIVQLYTLRSKCNWGIGDFSDLRYLIDKSAELGVDAIGLNPLHALKHPIEHNYSPYSPSDRRFINPLYIDPELEPEFEKLGVDYGLQKERLRQAKNVDYKAVSEVKYSVFRQLFQMFITNFTLENAERIENFKAFKNKEGQALKDFCVYQALDEKRIANRITQFSQKEMEQAQVNYADEIEFQFYLQWVAWCQLERSQAYAREKGMAIGLIRDLAVGANGSGAEVEMSHGLFCKHAAVGAPPDPLAEKGQNWGLPPMDPATLRKTNFAHFIGLLRDNMQACGALRIDHAMSLLRLWWCPPGKTADYGAYVYYPFHEMLGLLKLESVRNRCVVIGEDMGVVPPELRQALIDGNILTNKLFYFEKNNDNSFKLPEDYEKNALAMLTNHDVPTLGSWWSASDIHLREDLNQLEEGTTLGEALENRKREKKLLLQWLEQQSLVGKEQIEELIKAPMTREMTAIIVRACSRCASRLFVLQLEDLEQMDSPVNVPGTSDEYPNWQRKIVRNLEDIFADAYVKQTLEMVTSQRENSSLE